jgi:hypothetical protein
MSELIKFEKTEIQNDPFRISSLAEAEKIAKIISDSDFAPKDYKGKPGNVLIAMQMGYEVGLKPMQAIQNIAVINGRPQIWGDAALALVRNKPECKSITEWMEGSMDAQNAIAYCEVMRGSEKIRGEFSYQQAKKAGLIGKQGPWSQYPERMLKLRARGFALRDSFPDALKGLYIEGEMDDVVEDSQKIIDVNKGIDTVRTALGLEEKQKEEPVINKNLFEKSIEDAKTLEDLEFLVSELKKLPEADKKEMRQKFYDKKKSIVQDQKNEAENKEWIEEFNEESK